MTIEKLHSNKDPAFLKRKYIIKFISLIDGLSMLITFYQIEVFKWNFPKQSKGNCV